MQDCSDSFKNLFELTKKLQDIRKIPQYLFLETIEGESMMKVRTDIINYKRANPDANKIDFIILSPGGSPDHAYRIIRTLKNNFEEVNIVVPFWAKSAATLLSLGASFIIMDEFGEFGPLDIQIGVERDDSPEFDRESALNDEYSVRRIESRAQEMFAQIFTFLHENQKIKINKVELSKQLLGYIAAFYEPLLRQINPYSLGRKKRILDIGDHYAKRILRLYNPKLSGYTINYLVDYLVNRCPDHGLVVDYDLLRATQLPNILKSKEIGEDYSYVLTDIATIFIETDNHDDLKYIGFLPEEEKIKESEEVDAPTVDLPIVDADIREDGDSKIDTAKKEN